MEPTPEPSPEPSAAEASDPEPPPPLLRLRSREFGVVAVALLLLTLGLTHHAQSFAERLGYGSPDEALMVQHVWNTGRGRPLACSLERTHEPWEVSYFASHLDVSHLLYVPLTWISSSNAPLFGLNVLLALLGAVPLFLLAERKLKNRRYAMVVALLYLIYPLLDANAVRLGAYFNATVVVVLVALERLDAGKLRAAGAAFLLAPLMREEAALPVAAFLVSVAIVDKEKRAFALSIAAGGLAVFFIYVGLLRPHVFGPGPDFLGRYSHLGSSFGEIVFSPVRHPIVVGSHLFAPRALQLWALLLLPLCPALVLAPRHLLASFAAVAMVALSNRESDYVLGHYLVPAIPFLFAGLVVGLGRIQNTGRLAFLRDIGWNPALTALIVAVVLTGCAWTVDAGPFGRYKPLRAFSPKNMRYVEGVNPHYALAGELMAQIPDDASVSASNPLVIHLARRRELFLFPARAGDVDFVIVDTRDYVPHYPYYGAEAHREAVHKARSEPGVTVTEGGHYILIDRRKPR